MMIFQFYLFMKKIFDQIIKYIDNQDINSYINFIVEQLFAANKYFNDQELWNKRYIKTKYYSLHNFRAY